MPNELQLAQGLTTQLLPWVAVIMTGIIGIWLKDLIAKLAKGLAFSMNKSFNEGDKVILDNETALIVKIGLTQSVFGVIKKDGDYVWRYVPNERIPFLKFEKIIFDNSNNQEREVERNATMIEENRKQLEELKALHDALEKNK